jgi:hypothetical protein
MRNGGIGDEARARMLLVTGYLLGVLFVLALRRSEDYLNDDTEP